MKKWIILIVAFPVLVILLALFFWLTGNLYLRVNGAKATWNGTVSDKVEVYKSRNDRFFIFLGGGEQGDKIFMVDGRSGKVGIPTRPVPSSTSKSVKTNSFLFCLECPMTPAGTEKFDLKAELSLSQGRIGFKIYEDSVDITFDSP